MKSKKVRYFKFLEKNHISPFLEFDYGNYIPKDGNPGPWLPKVSRISLCHNGYHACKARDVINWYDKELYEVELRGRISGINEGKVVAQQMRFLRRVRGYSASKLEKFDNEFSNTYNNKEEKEVVDKVEKYILNLADKSK